MSEIHDNASKKQISINMVANIVSYSSHLVISFFLTPFLISSLGKDVYSFYPLASTIVSYLAILMNALNTIACRFFTVELVKKNEAEANKYFSSVLASNVILSAVMLIPMVVFISFIDVFLNVPGDSVNAIRLLFSLVFAGSIINVVGSIYGIATFAKNRIDLRSIREIIAAIIRLLLFLVLYSILPASIVYAGIVSLIIAFVNLIIQMAYTRKLLPGVRFNRNYVSVSHTLKLLSSTSWNIIFTFGNIFLTGMTLILLNILFDPDAAGSLSIVQTVPSFTNGVIVMLVGVFFPVITYKIAEADIQGAVEYITSAQRIIATIGCAVIVVFSGLATEFFSLWVPEENAHELSVLSFVTIIPHLFTSCTWILTNLNVAMNKIKKPAIYTVIIGVANIILAVIAVKLFNTPFISVQIISSVLQIVFAGIVLPIYASKELKISFGTFYPPIFRAIIASVICFFMTIKVKHFFVIENWFEFVVVGVVLGLVSLVIFALIELGPNRIKTYVGNVIKGK